MEDTRPVCIWLGSLCVCVCVHPFPSTLNNLHRINAPTLRPTPHSAPFVACDGVLYFLIPLMIRQLDYSFVGRPLVVIIIDNFGALTKNIITGDENQFSRPQKMWMCSSMCLCNLICLQKWMLIKFLIKNKYRRL